MVRPIILFCLYVLVFAILVVFPELYWIYVHKSRYINT